MKFVQKRFSNRVELDLHDESFDYAIKVSGVKKRFSVDYVDLDTTVHEEVEEANTWWRNVGIAWLLLGGIFTLMDYARSGELRISFVLMLGIACLGIYRFSRTSYTHHALAGGGRLVLIKDSRASSILDELTARRKAALLDLFGEIDFDADPENEIAKFMWLERQGVLSHEQTAAKIGEIEAALAEAPDEPASGVN